VTLRGTKVFWFFFSKKNILALLCLAIAPMAHATKPPTPTVKRAVAGATHGVHPGKLGGPARHGPSIGGPAPKADAR
jgi:hypothetical protein